MCVYVCELLEMINKVKTCASDAGLEMYFPPDSGLESILIVSWKFELLVSVTPNWGRGQCSCERLVLLPREDSPGAPLHW